MTDPQRTRFYFPQWNDACRRLGWRMDRGTLRMASKPANEHQRQVIAAAQRRAAGERRSATVDDLRHGCTIVALGRDKDTVKLNNGEVDKIVCLFKLLVNPVNISADIRMADPTIAEREALVIKINRLNVPFAVINVICRRSFAPDYTEPFFEDLKLPQLRALLGILQERSLERRQLVEQPF